MANEDALEPVSLIRQSGVVLRVGKLLIGAGAGGYRVKIAMRQVARALGLDNVEAQVSVTEIVATCHRGPIFRTEVIQNNHISVNADRIILIERYVAMLKSGTSVAEIDRFLDETERKPVLYGLWVNALFSAIACVAFAFLNNGGLVEMSAVFFGAGLGQLVRRLMIHRGANHLGVTMLSAAISSIVYLGIVNLLFTLNVVDSVHEAGYVSAVLFLVPGFPLITAALDFSRLDFSAGLSRLSYALLLLMSAALSLWAVSAVMGLTPVPADPLNIPTALGLTLRFVASAAGVWGFAMLFNSPLKVAIAAAGIGMLANTLRLEIIDLGMLPQGAAAFAGLAVGILANVVAPRMGVPRLTLCVPAAVIMVPGTAAYRAIYYLNDGQTVEALAYGVEATLIVIALAIGLTVARGLTDPVRFLQVQSEKANKKI